ncbi:ATP-binding protein [Chloroflexota bacterium]
MNFYVDKSAEYLEKGIEQQRGGNRKDARFNFLKAAEFLYKAAQESVPSLRDERIKRAEQLIKRGEELGKLLNKKQGTAIGELSADSADGSEWLMSERPSIRLSGVAGLENVKEQIRLKMIYPFTHSEQAEKFGIKKGGGLLLYGPPGTGKTMIAKAIAGEIDAYFYTVKPSEIMSKWVGEAEQNIGRLFSAARQQTRAIIFIDEVESLIPKRSHTDSSVMARVVPQILAEMEGVGKESEKGVLLFVAATNEPWSLDEAVRRPGRFDELIYVPLPDYDARRKILSLNLAGKPLSEEVLLDELAETLDGYSGADIKRICEKASDIPFIEAVMTGNERNIEMRDLLTVMQQVRPSVTTRMSQKFEKFIAEGG